ncbi:DUF4239 domain-containing protein [Roseateles amylovorans]|uniref:DUF4239 domain-containing protein n=1 Tax=Roseateles amylovorans TaxID=2978473 RepID=A0ABY6AZC3_9BURK|nr:DUF4239 domain-containing protein [Roseateles amylovorans]UXH78263.1 DUF4239 domain-containing protein [Roseateles amylovorans]
MPLWIYQLPVWQFGVLLMTGWMVPAMASFEVIHRFLKPRFEEADKGLAMTLLALVATLNSLLLAFCAVSVWDAYRSADNAVSNEAVTISELARDLGVLGTPAALAARERLREYTRSIVDDEWVKMQKEPGHRDNGDRINRIFRALQTVEPTTPAQTILLTEIWARMNEVLKFRLDRVSASELSVPATLWFVVIAGGVLSLMPMLVLPPTAFNRTAVALLSCSTGLVFFFIVQMDRPFVGEQSVSPQPYEISLQEMAQWDLGPR